MALISHSISKNSKGVISITNLKIHCFIGLLPHEKNHKQDIFIDLKVETDFLACAQSDDVRDTVNYVSLAELCSKLTNQKHYHLLETFAWDLVHALHDDFDIIWAWVKIKKPLAIPMADFTSIEWQLHRDHYELDVSNRGK